MSNKRDKSIYFDHAATTPVDREVREVVCQSLKNTFGNPSGWHAYSRQASILKERARQAIADFYNCYPEEIIFTSGGTESINLAIRGVAWQQKTANQGNHIITSAIEHPAVTETVNQLCKYHDFEKTVLPVDGMGLVNPDDLAKAIKPETVLISLIFGSNEVGSIQPIEQFVRIAREKEIIFHCDAVQSNYLFESFDQNLPVDLLSISGHKIYAPKGIGILFKKRGVEIFPQITGGGQENGLKSGTENLAYILGLAKAIELMGQKKESEREKLSKLNQYFIEGVLNSISGSQLTGDKNNRVPGLASFVFQGIKSDTLLMHLDICGFALSAGSACSAGRYEANPVLLAMGYSYELASSSLRISLGRHNSRKDVDSLLANLISIISKIRK